ncbi:MAG: homoserine O-acetyltransferase [Armatimonadetes bacterium]|nr:homoserine O-acetyltransferase [Armatimonadota bacterium]
MAESMLAVSDAGSVGLVDRQFFTFASPQEPFRLEGGGLLPEVTQCYETYGTLNASGTNAILIEHGITGSSHAAGRYRMDSPYAGYWELLIGPGKALDTDRYFVIAPNALGGCRGATGPQSINPRTNSPYADTFPTLTIRDMVRAQRPLIDALGVRRLHLVAGGSMGGMQALEWAVTYPEMVDACCPVASSARNSAQAIAFNECMRRAIRLDPNWQGGRYYGGEPPRDGLALARMIGTITYLSDPIMQRMFGRKSAREESAAEHDLHIRFDVERYLHEEGEKLIRRFDANTYVVVSRAIDLHDLSRGYSSLEAAYQRLQAVMLLIGISSDILFYPHHIVEMDEALRRLGVDSTYWEMDSDYGHDAFLVEQQKLEQPLRDLLTRLPAPA